MKLFLSIGILVTAILSAQALSITEIMSNPVGDDSGREWIELYNNGNSPVDLSSLAVSIKGGTLVAVVLLQGNPTIAPGEYAIISSIVSSTNPSSRFLDSALGYPSYTGSLFRTSSSVSLVNTGVTSIDIRLQGSVADSIASYTPAPEGKTLSLISGAYISGMPTPGQENQAFSKEQTQEATSSDNQVTIARASPPSPDIVLYLTKEKIVVAGAETDFSVYGMTRGGKTIEDMKASWAFGDGGEAKGTSTTYTYAYPGRYIARVEAGNSYVMGVGEMNVIVVSPEIAVTSFSKGKYGSYIDISNPNEYDMELSQWRLHIGDAAFPFPKNTVLPKRSTTHISGKAMGFASTTPDEKTLVKITFPNLEEVTRFVPISATATIAIAKQTKKLQTLKRAPAQEVKTSKEATSSPVSIEKRKDTRLAIWFKTLFSR